MAANNQKSNPSPLTAQGFGLPRLVMGGDSRLKKFFSNLRDFLGERPPKVRSTGQRGAFTDPGFGAGMFENLGEFFRSTPAAARRPVHSAMVVEWQPWYSNFWTNLSAALKTQKLPPLPKGSRPVPEIWSRNEGFKRAQALSVAAHVVVAIILIVPFLPKLMAPATANASSVQVTPIDISPYLPKLPPGPKKAGGGGGGGEHNPIAASKGKLPKFDWTQYAKPAVKPPLNPRMAMTPTVLGPPELRLPSPNMPNWGDPMSKVVNDSSGPGSGAGIGSGSGGGVGSGSGGGVGPGEQWGVGGGYPSAGANGYGVPTCLYCPRPEYSDEAVKAKYQGVVVLQVVITSDGRAINPKVVKGLGLGLDEKAVEQVRTWRFKPAAGPDGKLAAVVTLIEVTFRLL